MNVILRRKNSFGANCFLVHVKSLIWQKTYKRIGIFGQNNAFFHFFWSGASILANLRARIHFGAKPLILWQNIVKPRHKVTSVVLSLNFNAVSVKTC